MTGPLIGPASLLGGHFVNQQIIAVYIIHCSHHHNLLDFVRSDAKGQSEIKNEKLLFVEQINRFLNIHRFSSAFENE